MSSVEIDSAGAYAVAQELKAIGELLAELRQPPAVNWGDDKFGAVMRQQYPEDVAAQCQESKQQLGERCRAIGEAVEKAVRDYLAEDRKNAEQLGRVKV